MPTLKVNRAERHARKYAVHRNSHNVETFTQLAMLVMLFIMKSIKHDNHFDQD